MTVKIKTDIRINAPKIYSLRPKDKIETDTIFDKLHKKKKDKMDL